MQDILCENCCFQTAWLERLGSNVIKRVVNAARHFVILQNVSTKHVILQMDFVLMAVRYGIWGISVSNISVGSKVNISNNSFLCRPTIMFNILTDN